MAVDHVVVVGAGPVGLTVALAVAQTGRGVVVLEREGRETPITWKGSTIHPPTLELLERLGLAGAIVAGGVMVDRLQYRDSELEPYAEMDYSLLQGATPYPFRLQFEQYKLLELLRSTCDASPDVDVRYHHEVVGIEGTATDRPTVRTRAGAGGPAEDELACDLVVAADGARSDIRKALDIDFVGTTYPGESAVLATDYDMASVARDIGPVSYWTSPSGKLSMIRTPDHWRLSLSLPGDHPDEEPNVVGRQRLGQLFGLPPDLPLNQAAKYRTHQRVAATLRRGRVCLVGDAAHVNSPTGGLGLNSGIQDAFDLAARLAAGGDADDALDAYAQVRAEVAHRVVQEVSGQNTEMVATRERVSRERLLDHLRAIAGDPARATEYLLRVSMLSGVRAYPPGVAVAA